jgi:hypothetical protein
MMLTALHYTTVFITSQCLLLSNVVDDVTIPNGIPLHSPSYPRQDPHLAGTGG